MTRSPVCPNCESRDVGVAGSARICRACQWRWEATLAEVLNEDEVASVVSGVVLRSPGHEIAGGYHPDTGSLERGIAGLSKRRIDNRMRAIEQAIATLDEIEEIIARNVEVEWGRRWKSEWQTSPLEFEGSPEAAISALDRVLRRVRGFEGTWDRVAHRDPGALWRTPWDYAGRHVAQDLDLLAQEREFLQAARTILVERA